MRYLYTAILFLFFITGTIQAQKVGNFVFEGKVSDSNSGQRLSGVKVTLYKDGAVFATSTTSGNGKYEVIGPPGHNYKVEFSKPGMVPKHVIFDFKTVKDEDMGKYDFPVELEMSLFENVEGVDFSLLKNKPIGKAVWDPKDPALVVFDYGYTKQIKKQVDKLLKEAEEKRKAEEERKKKEAEKLEQYNKLMENGNSSFSGGNYEKALQSYQQAQQLFPDKAEPKQKITETETKIEEAKKEAAEAEKRKKYDALIADADKAFDGKNYETALQKYNEALVLFPSESHPSNRIIEIDDILAKKKAEEEAAQKKEQEYKNFITAADNLLQQKKYEDAKSKYQSASKIKPDEKYPKDKIAEIEQLIAEAEANAEKEKEYNVLIAKADQAFDAENYEDAKSSYEKALAIKPNESHPTSRIAEIKTILDQLANQEAQQKKYDEAISAGDQAMDAENYEEAKKQYNIASDTKPDENYPKNQLSKIEKILKDLAEEEATNQAYEAAIKSADQKFNAKDYEGALEKYQEAKGIKPDEQKPQEKIDEINQILSNLEAQQEKEQQYTALMADAENLFSNKSYEEAKSKFKEASALKPDEQKPKDKIAEIEKIMSELQSQQQKDEKYNTLITEGNQLFNSKDYEQAKEKYEAALQVKPGESEPKEKIAEIEQLLKELEEQKKQEEIDAKYQAAIGEADGAFNSEEYQKAKSKYQEASNIKPDESYPNDKIKEIEDILDKLAAEDAEAKEYNDKIKEADNLFDAKSYDQAIAKYEEASGIKPDEQYPVDRIQEIKEIQTQLEKEAQKEKEYQTLITDADSKFKAEDLDAAKSKYEKASQLKPGESYPKEQIEKINSLQASEAEKEQLEQKFNALVEEAKSLYDQESWEASLAKYQEASELKPSHQEVKDKITDIKNKLQALSSQQETQEKYDKLIAEADAKFNNKQYAESKEVYKKAAEVIPSESYPQQQIDKANELMKQQTDQEKEKQYQKLIAAADKKFDAEDYSSAKDYYQRAVSMKPEDSYPKDQLSAIEAKLKSLAKQNNAQEEYDAIITKADNAFQDKSYQESKKLYKEAASVLATKNYPQEQINKINDLLKQESANELQAQYQKIIDKADGLYEDKDYEKSLTYYERASKIKPDDPYPQDQIKAIKELLKSLEQVEANKEKEKEYNTLVNEADRLYESKQWKEAKRKYADAYAVMPKEYPQNQIYVINEMMKKERDELLKGQYEKIIAKADGLFDDEDYIKSKSYYERALRLKPDDKYPREQIDEINRLIALEQQKERGVAMTDYGKPVKNQSVMDGEALLLEAEAKRRFMEQQEVVEMEEEMKSNIKEWSSDNYDNTIEIRKYTENIRTVEFKNKTNWAEGTRENELLIKEFIDKLVDSNLQLASYDQDDIYRIRSMVENMNEVTAQLQYEGDQTRKDNELEVIEFNDGINKEQERYSNESYDQIIDSRNYVEDMTENIEDLEYEGDQTRKDNELDVIEFNDGLNKEQERYSNESYDQIIDSRNYVEDMIENIENLEYEGDQTRKDSEAKIGDFNDELAESRHIEAEEKYDEIIDTNDNIEDIVTQSDKFNKEADKVREKNTDDVEDFIDQLNETKINQIEDTDISRNQTEDKLNNIKAYEPMNMTPDLANKLAEDYPEGVTEKSYNIKDSQGLVIRVITRRIVVKGNRGDVYERIQSKFGLSYTKNNEPITEHIWVTATQDASLVRHNDNGN